VSLIVDVMHLVIIATGVAIGAWALIALRRSLPRGRFVVFAASSSGALFGCAALAGEVGPISPVAWYAILMVAMAAVTAAAVKAGRPKAGAA
jgi:hypothetical protein